MIFKKDSTVNSDVKIILRYLRTVLMFSDWLCHFIIRIIVLQIKALRILIESLNETSVNVTTNLEKKFTNSFFSSLFSLAKERKLKPIFIYLNKDKQNQESVLLDPSDDTLNEVEDIPYTQILKKIVMI
ncbi:hypothetical protein BpHYR1_031833 [Brachionus plicatilis]|uniref:Uncharacterized protein n=1 Tax=Brachionus plicatilis TaxID=10195 RepID=A0A3M7SYH5_BRAPC|nr:hypothetical protein BpHYR1_031833 [Brachionus plicatilis]